MGSSFLITLREGLEASLIISILLSYLVKTNRQSENRVVWYGTLVAIAVCAIAGTLVYVFVDGLHGRVEQAVEGVIAVAAMLVLTQMIFWMRANARNLGSDLRNKVDGAKNKALFVIAFVAVFREGLETALFLLGAKTETASGWSVVIGGLIGLVASSALGFAVFKAGSRLKLKTFFNVTAILLLLFAAGLAGKAVHELRELIGWETGLLITPAWNIETGVWSAGGTFYDFMKGLFGWHANPERLRVGAYFVYLIPVLASYLKSSKTDKQLVS
jgi:high-affinity iron transporter